MTLDSQVKSELSAIREGLRVKAKDAERAMNQMNEGDDFSTQIELLRKCCDTTHEREYLEHLEAVLGGMNT